MKVIGIVGSPRRAGNTAKLVEEVLAGAREAGHETRVFYLAEMKLGHLGHDGDGYVYPEDDFTSMMPHLETMGALVVGTPIYYDHVSSLTKLFIDRLYYYSKSHGQEYRKRFPDGVKCINIVTCGWDNPNAYDEVLDWVDGRMRNYWRMTVLEGIRATGTGNRPVAETRELLKRARELGRGL